MISAIGASQPTAETNKTTKKDTIVGSEMLQKLAGEAIVIADIFCPAPLDRRHGHGMKGCIKG
jgi:hypothetical protein